MISPDHLHLMARYNRWQNQSLYAAAAALTDAERRQERGAFFGSIHATLSHLLWGDSIWMHRFTGSEKPTGGIKDSPQLYQDWAVLMAERIKQDEAILAWAAKASPDWLAGSLSWITSSTGKEMTLPCWMLAIHFFNHQTHHRGQVHAMLTAAGAKPEATDIPFMPG